MHFGVQLDSDEVSSSSGESSDDEGVSADDSRSIWKQWLNKLSKHDLKMMSLMLTDTYIECFGITKTGAAKESALLLRLNDKTVRIWRKGFYTKEGTFSQSKQGKHSRPYILDDENL